MAGSSVQPPQDHDPTLSSRLDGLKLLAEHLSEPIVIFSPAMKLVYANPSADKIAQECPLIEQTQQEGLDPSHCVLEPCEACPGKQILEVSQAAVHSRKSHTPVAELHKTCPLPQAVPLAGEKGQVGYVVMMGSTAQESMVLKDDVTPIASHDPVAVTRENERQIELIGESQPMQQLIEMIHLVAASEATVLIQGESGTGKELVAKTIHRLSPRRDHPFVVVECSSLPETLLESELFGHVRGSFTGATADRKGLFEEAEGGTIFLDEIADTNSVFQAKLLRALQEGEIKPVGSSQSIKVNVRVISACNRSLTDMIKSKAFRVDLYYRLAVLPITIPPLRERPSDVALLVTHFFELACRKHSRDEITIAPEAVDALVRHTWPGNVRELENLLERVVVTAKGPRITVGDLFGVPVESHHPKDLSTISKAARHKAEKTKIVETLRKAGGDKTKTARLLNISRASLYNKLKSYQIQ